MGEFLADGTISDSSVVNSMAANIALAQHLDAVEKLISAERGKLKMFQN